MSYWRCTKVICVITHRLSRLRMVSIKMTGCRGQKRQQRLVNGHRLLVTISSLLTLFALAWPLRKRSPPFTSHLPFRFLFPFFFFLFLSFSFFFFLFLSFSSVVWFS